MKECKIIEGPGPYPQHWPPEEYACYQQDVEIQQLTGLEQLLNKGVTNETQVDTYLRENPEIIVCLPALSCDGHHASWVVPQQVIRPPRHNIIPGLKPDFILGGRSSDGFTWYVVELKSPNQDVFSETKGDLRLSATANRGVIQLLEYIDYCSEIQAYLRDILRLTDFREPQGILLIGNESEFEHDSRRQHIKAAWNKNTPRLRIRTYDALVRSAKMRV